MNDAHKDEKIKIKINKNNNRSEPSIVHPWNIQRAGCVSIVGHPQTKYPYGDFGKIKQNLTCDGLPV